MSKIRHLARHRATPVHTSPFKSVSKAVVSNAGSLGRPVAVVAASSALMLGMGASANAAEQHTVVRGDTLGEIAAQNNVSLQTVFSLNGLGWNSIIYPGDTIETSATEAVASNSAAATSSGNYTVKSGDTLGKIAAEHGVSLQTVFSLNGLGWSSVIYPGDTINVSGNAPFSNASGTVAQENTSTPAPAPASAAQNTTGLSTASNNVQPISTGSTASSVSTSGIAATAQSMAGSPYVYGGTSPSAGWDCSGFVQWAYAQNGIDLPRTYQWNAMAATGNPQPGDLVVQNGGSHVGIYLGNGKMVSALNPSQGTLVHDVSAMPVMGFYTTR